MALDNDLSPQSEAQPDIVSPEANAAESPGDGYGSLTNTAGTPTVRVCPPKIGYFTRVTSWIYDNAATAHTVTPMVPLEKCLVSTDAAAGQAVIKFDHIPTNTAGAKIASGDWFVVKDEAGIFGSYLVSSVSALAVTITASRGSADGSGFVNKIPAGRIIWYFGSPTTDHAKRGYTMKASVVTTMPPGNWCTTPNKHEPILVHDDNGTNAGTLTALSYANVVI